MYCNVFFIHNRQYIISTLETKMLETYIIIRIFTTPLIFSYRRTNTVRFDIFSTIMLCFFYRIVKVLDFAVCRINNVHFFFIITV